MARQRKSATPRPAWKWVLRNGILPELTTAQLRALHAGLLSDDPLMLQDEVTEPPDLLHNGNATVQAAGPLAYCGWRGAGFRGEQLTTVGQVNDFYHALVRRAETRLGVRGAVFEHLEDWVSCRLPETVVRQLLVVVARELRRRGVR